MEDGRQAMRVDPEGGDALLSLALQRVDLLVRRAALGQRLLGVDPNDPYRGLVLSDEEVDGLLQFPLDGERPQPSHSELDSLSAQLAEVDARLESMAQPPASRLGWLLAQPAITSPIIGANSVEQLEESLAVVDLSLNEVQLEKLNQASNWKSE